MPVRGGDSAEHEFRIQPVAALLEIASVRHLRDQIRGAEQCPSLRSRASASWI